jgi:hypothetical protein
VTPKGLLVAVAVAAWAAPAGAAPTCRTESAEVESAIAAKAKELSMAEYCQFRRYDALDDVDGDGKEDFLALFTLEGPNGANRHVTYLACFPSAIGAAASLVRAGERGERDPVELRVEGHRIVLSTLEYRPGDPMCCPSGKGRLVYERKDGRLRPGR